MYRTGSTLFIIDRTGLTLDGRGATIWSLSVFAATQEIIFARAGGTLTFRDLTIRGNHPNPGTYTQGEPEFQAGIALVGVQEALVEDVTVLDNMGDGVGAYAFGTIPTRDVTVRNSTFSGQGRWGVTFTYAERGLVELNTLSNLTIAFEFEPDVASPAHFVRDITVRDNIISGAVKNLAGGYGPGTLANITIERNTVLAGPNRGIWSYFEPSVGNRASNIIFRDNVGEQAFSEDPGWTGVLLLCDTDGATVTGNTQPVVPGTMPGVRAADSTGITVSGNTFAGATSEYVTGGYACPWG